MKVFAIAIIALLLAGSAMAYQVEKVEGYEDGKFTAKVICDDKILVYDTTGSLVNGQVVDWFKAIVNGHWHYVTVVNGLLDVQPTKNPY